MVIFVSALPAQTIQALTAPAPPASAPDFFASTFTPGMMAKFSLGVLYDQATVQTRYWGSDAKGLEKRAEWRMAGLLTRASVEYAVARSRGVTTAYERCRCKGFLPRSRHVLVSELTEKRADGSYAPPISRMAGMAAGVAVVTVAQHSDAAGGGERALLLLNTDIGFNMLNEFWPEVKRTLLFRKR